ncbi:MAG: DUF1287 domain-containing protein [Pseudomonadota bacterium]
MLSRRAFSILGLATIGVAGVYSRSHAQVSLKPFAQAEPWARKLIDAANEQIGITVRYDPSYQKLDFPMGDIPREAGVCTDVVIRAYRDAFKIDLQAAINADMKANFSKYPKIWGLKRTDKNIDHRRVPNIERFLEHKNAALEISSKPSDYLPGDIVSQRLPGNLPHIGIVSDVASHDGKRPMMIHNIGAGTRLEDRVFEFDIVGHFRVPPEQLT